MHIENRKTQKKQNREKLRIKKRTKRCSRAVMRLLYPVIKIRSNAMRYVGMIDVYTINNVIQHNRVHYIIN